MTKYADKLVAASTQLISIVLIALHYSINTELYYRIELVSLLYSRSVLVTTIYGLRGLMGKIKISLQELKQKM